MANAFSDYLYHQNIRQTQAAADLGVTDGRVSQLCNGVGSGPSLALALRIEHWSGGVVGAGSWAIGDDENSS